VRNLSSPRVAGQFGASPSAAGRDLNGRRPPWWRSPLACRCPSFGCRPRGAGQHGQTGGEEARFDADVVVDDQYGIARRPATTTAAAKRAAVPGPPEVAVVDHHQPFCRQQRLHQQTGRALQPSSTSNSR
jgi:hypothetical protein